MKFKNEYVPLLIVWTQFNLLKANLSHALFLNSLTKNEREMLITAIDNVFNRIYANRSVKLQINGKYFGLKNYPSYVQGFTDASNLINNRINS